MTSFRLILRSLAYFRAAHLALLAGMALVTAVLTGALLLGDSVRESLADLAHRRSGGFGAAITSPGLFGESLARRLTDAGHPATAGLVLPGRVRAERTALSGGVQLVALQAHPVRPGHALITRNLAEALQLQPNDVLLVTLAQSHQAHDAVLAHRDRTTLTSLRVTVDRILDERALTSDDAFLAWFDLNPSQRPPTNVWLNIGDLQESLQGRTPREDRITLSPANFLLLKGGDDRSDPSLQIQVAPVMTLVDYGLSLGQAGSTAILRSGALYIPQSMAQALAPVTPTATPVHALLLDRVTAEGAEPASLSYVMAAGVDGALSLDLRDAEVAVNQWTADQLRLRAGDRLRVFPYRLEGDDVVVADAAEFTVAKVLPMTGIGADPTLTPRFPGLTDAATMASWDPPAGFAFDSSRVTAADEDYWDRYQAAPKVFLTLGTAQRLAKAIPAGDLTSIRIPAEAAPAFEREALPRLSPALAGFTATPVAPPATTNTDFAGLFLGLSGFLIIAALLLVVLLFRLAVEQRLRQLGLLTALGFTPSKVVRLVLAEGLVVVLAGTFLGLAAAVGFASLLVRGLGSWWIGATGTHILATHIYPLTLLIGGIVSFVAAAGAVGASARRLAVAIPIGPLRDELPQADPSTRTPRLFVAFGAALLALLPVTLAVFGHLPASLAFLLSGFLLLATAIAVVASLPLRWRRGGLTLAHLAVASMLRRRTPAVLCLALMATATFLLLSVTAFESAPTASAPPPSSTGGYQLVVSTQIPLPADLSTPAGRKLLGLGDGPLLHTARFTPLRVRQGDDLSCLNMTQPAKATLIGVPPEVLDRFAVARRQTLASSEQIGAALDAQSAQYILHTHLGAALPVAAATRPVVVERLLTDSLFQNAALIREADFRELFPEVTRSSLALVDCPVADAPALQTLLQRHLDDFGVTVETTAQRIAGYHAVADGYIAAFQFLGVLALLVGGLGQVVVLVGGILRRRSELALLQAIGFTPGRVVRLLVIEHGLLLGGGLLLGLLTALLAVFPRIGQVHGVPVAIASGVILGTGLLVLILAARLAMRRLTPAALRQE